MENQGCAMDEKLKQRFIEELEKIKAGLSKKEAAQRNMIKSARN